jgi:diguanylate cyclase (GGDEF)-like protein
MSLRLKTALIFILSLTVLIVALTLGLRGYLLNRLDELEQQEIRSNGERVLRALANETDGLDAILRDWVHWESGAEGFPGRERRIPTGTFRHLRLGLVIRLDAAGQPLFHRQYDAAQQRQQPVPAPLLRKVIAPVMPRLAGSAGSKGFLELPGGLLIFAARPVGAVPGRETQQGYLIMGRYLTRPELARIARMLDLRLELLSRRQFREWRGSRAVSPGQARVWVEARNSRAIDGYVPLVDLDGRPVAAVRLTIPREIYHQGQLSLWYFSVAMLILGVILSLLMLAFLEKSVLSRLAFLNERVCEIAASNDLSIRIPISKRDELTSYATVFNQMMDSLEDSRLELERNREQLASANQQLLNIIDFLPDATFVINCQGKVVAWNRAIAELTGITKQEILGLGYYAYAFPFWGEPRPLLIDLVTADFDEIRRYYPSAEQNGPILQAEVFLSKLHQGRGIYALISAAPLYDHAGNLVGAIETIHDISNRKKVEEQLRYLGWHDQLTGMYNRTYFEREIERFQHGEYSRLGLVMCDVDGLKSVNDSQGHAAGDRLLRSAAELITAAAQGNQIAARVGGDEFAILLPDCTLDEPQQIQRRLTELLDAHNQAALAGSEPKLSISLGWAISDDRKTVQEVFEEADNNMYRKKLHRSQSLHSNVIQILMKTLAARDFITEGHAERMKHLVQHLAERTGLPERKVQDLKLLAEIHDIGKIGIADNILFKPGVLTPEEQQEIQRHSEIGQSIAESAQELSYLSDWILKHHEWWDGSGYPLGLKGLEIPLECRILAIADAFDAMTSDRPYRRAMPTQEALAELVRGAGTQFDPELVKSFVALVTEGVIRRSGDAS